MPQNPRPYNSRILNKATIILIIHRWGVKIFVNHDNYSQRVWCWQKGLGSPEPWVWVLALPFTGQAALGKSVQQNSYSRLWAEIMKTQEWTRKDIMLLALSSSSVKWEPTATKYIWQHAGPHMLMGSHSQPQGLRKQAVLCPALQMRKQGFTSEVAWGEPTAACGAICGFSSHHHHCPPS